MFFLFLLIGYCPHLASARKQLILLGATTQLINMIYMSDKVNQRIFCRIVES